MAEIADSLKGDTLKALEKGVEEDTVMKTMKKLIYLIITRI